MASKQLLSFRVPAELAERFQEATKPYHGKLGICFGAAMLMFLEKHPEVQTEYMQRVMKAELEEEMQSVIEQAKADQLKQIKTRDASSKPKRTP